MRSLTLLAASALALAAGAAPATLGAQSTTPSITFYSLPAYLGQSVTITADTPDLAAQAFARKAQSARVIGEWTVCNTVNYGGTCRTLAANTPYIGKATVVSVRPVAATTSAAATDATTSATAGASVDLDALDVTEGTSGQDVAFYAQPSFGSSQVSAGSNDRAAADAFCKQAGAASSVYASRGRVQTSNLIDLSSKTRVRAFPLRDVLCKR